MRKINFLTVAAALILAGVGTWAASTTHASVTAPLEIGSIPNDDERPQESAHSARGG